MSNENVKYGDRIILNKNRYGIFDAGQELVVGKVISSRGAVLAGVEGNTGVEHSIKGVMYFDEDEYTIKPKAKKSSKLIPLEDVRVDDTIVAFWEIGGVETRRKGYVTEIDDDGDALGSFGEFITYDHDHGTAEYIYLLERVEEPTGFAALEKSKTYFLKSYSGIINWYLQFNRGTNRWTYGNGTDASAWEGTFTSGADAWEKPIEVAPYAAKHRLDPAKEYVVRGALYQDVHHIKFVDGEWLHGYNNKGFIRIGSYGMDGFSDPVEYKGPEFAVGDWVKVPKDASGTFFGQDVVGEVLDVWDTTVAVKAPNANGNRISQSVRIDDVTKASEPGWPKAQFSWGGLYYALEGGKLMYLGDTTMAYEQRFESSYIFAEFLGKIASGQVKTI